MEMSVKIDKVEDKVASNGKPYTRFKTTSGWMSAFDTNIIEKLKIAYATKIVAKVDVMKTEKYTNIKAYLGQGNENDVRIPETTFEPPKEKKASPVKNGIGMFTRQAVDTFCTILKGLITGNDSLEISDKDAERIMEKSIKLVKQAKEAFENGSKRN